MYVTARHHFHLVFYSLKIAKEQTPSYYKILNRRVDGFVGREDILQRIDKALSGGLGPRYTVLQGMGGQGQSQVALEYCRRKKDSPYSAIFWVDATTENSVKGSFKFISERIKVETDYLPNIDARVAFVLKTLTSWTVKWLIVFDNYGNPGTFPNIRNLMPQSGLGAILVTKQANHFLELSGLEESAAVALLVQQSQTNEVISSDAKKIVERLGCHRLAITQAGAYIRKRKLRLCEFVDYYKRRKKDNPGKYVTALSIQKKIRQRRRGNIIECITTWELSFQQLQSKASENDVEAKLLTLLAFFDEKDISEQLFAGFSTNQEQISESAKLLKWLNAFNSGDGQWNSDLFEDVLIRWRDSSLLQAFARGLDGFYLTSLHPLIKDWTRLRINKSISQENTYMAATIVSEILVNSVQKQHFDLPLLGHPASCACWSHYIAS